MNLKGWQELTWKIETASKSNGLVSGEAFFPLRSLQLTLISLMGSNPFSPCFFFIRAKRDWGSLSAPLTKTFLKVECILLQSLQQSQLPFGNSCHLLQTYVQKTKGKLVPILIYPYINNCTPLEMPSCDPSNSQHDTPFHTTQTVGATTSWLNKTIQIPK